MTLYSIGTISKFSLILIVYPQNENVLDFLLLLSSYANSILKLLIFILTESFNSYTKSVDSSPKFSKY